MYLSDLYKKIKCQLKKPELFNLYALVENIFSNRDSLALHINKASQKVS